MAVGRHVWSWEPHSTTLSDRKLQDSLPQPHSSGARLGFQPWPRLPRSSQQTLLRARCRGPRALACRTTKQETALLREGGAQAGAETGQCPPGEGQESPRPTQERLREQGCAHEQVPSEEQGWQLRSVFLRDQAMGGKSAPVTCPWLVALSRATAGEGGADLQQAPFQRGV